MSIRDHHKLIRFGFHFILYIQSCQTETDSTRQDTLILNFSPSGNAYEHKRGEEWVFQCQHGEDECQVNMVETCALHLLPPIHKMDYIYCIEMSRTNPTVNVGKNDTISCRRVETAPYKGVGSGNFFHKGSGGRYLFLLRKVEELGLF